MSQTEVNHLIQRLHDAQQQTTRRVSASANYETLDYRTPDGFTVLEALRMWGWHFWSHHRTLVRARGSLEGDNPAFHVPHFVREAYEQFGRFVGELACLTDEQLDLKPPDGQRTIRETIEHVIESLSHYTPEQIEQSAPAGPTQ